MIDAKDKALLKASALVGYCESADHDALDDDGVRARWLKSLRVYAEGTGTAISEVWATTGSSVGE